MHQQQASEEEPMTYDEVSMQRSKHFVNALQELKNLRPQLYSAAEYCEMSYLHNEQKQMVLDNLKDYAVKALVNAVDYLGTVAYKLNDLLNQQTTDLSTTELKIACLNQRLRMCQEYTDKEGLRQQWLVDSIPRYHKHYVLPIPTTRHIDTGAEKWLGRGQDTEQAKPQPVPSGTNVSRSLSWHLASENRIALNGNSNTSLSNEFRSTSSTAASELFFFLEAEVPIASLSASSSRIQSMGGTPGSTTPPSSIGAGRPASQETSKSLTALLCFNNRRIEAHQHPSRSKMMLSTLFSRNKSMKQKIGRKSGRNNFTLMRHDKGLSIPVCFHHHFHLMLSHSPLFASLLYS